MTLRFRDSFSHYGDSGSKWSSGGGSIQTSGGRWGGPYLSVVSGYGGVSGPSVLLPAAATWYVGVALCPTGAWQWEGTNGEHVFQLRDGLNGPQVSLRLDSLGRLFVQRGSITSNPGPVLWTDSVPLGALGQWHYVEFGVTIGATGSFEVRVDGVTRSGVQSPMNTQATGNASANTVGLGFLSAGGAAIAFNDFYACDSAGTRNNTFLGDVRVQALMPAADGDLSQFTPSSGTTHYNLVDEIPPDGDTSYVSSPTPGNVDLYQLGDVAAVSGSILGVAVYSFARKDDAGTRTIANVIKTGGVEYDGPAQALSMSYTYFTEHWETNPATGLPWTIADVNALQVGCKVVA